MNRGKNKFCHWCRRRLHATTAYSLLRATRDHVHPKSAGGRDTVWACYFCNNLKQNKSLEDWTRFMLANPLWWSKPEIQSLVGAPRRGESRKSWLQSHEQIMKRVEAALSKPISQSGYGG